MTEETCPTCDGKKMDVSNDLTIIKDRFVNKYPSIEDLNNYALTYIRWLVHRVEQLEKENLQVFHDYGLVHKHLDDANAEITWLKKQSAGYLETIGKNDTLITAQQEEITRLESLSLHYCDICHKLFIEDSREDHYCGWCDAHLDKIIESPTVADPDDKHTFDVKMAEFRSQIVTEMDRKYKNQIEQLKIKFARQKAEEEPECIGKDSPNGKHSELIIKKTGRHPVYGCRYCHELDTDR